MSAITAKASRKMKKYAVLTREPRCFLGSFDLSWEQRKLSEMCGTFEYGLNAAAKEFDGKNKYIRITDIDDASREFLLSDLSSPDICLDGMSKYLLSSGDIVFARTGASVGKTYIYRENDGIVYFAGFLIRAKVNQDNDAEFVFQSTLSPSYEKYIRITSQRSGQPGVNAQEYGEYDLFAPSKEEQQRIGHFLRGIDNLITLHQRKCALLFSPFQSFISMMFTTSTFSWEQRKFSDITFPAGEKNRDNLPLESYSITNEHGFVPQDEKFENGGTMREADKRMYYIVSPNSFAYNPARINVGSIGYQNIGKNVIVSSLYEVFKTSEDVDDRLLWHWFKSPDFQKLIMQLQEGGVRLYFYYDKLCMGEVSLPSLEEQRKIGKLFDTLDNLITLHQRKCIFFTGRAGRLISTVNKKRITSSWEQRKFSELYEKVSRKNDLTYGKDDIISVANMYFKADSYITDESYLLTYNIFELGDIAFEGNKSKNYAHGRFVENTIGNGIVSHVFDVFKPIMKPYDLQFWKYAINNEQLMGGILLRSTKASTMMTNLVANDFLQETFLVPAYPEQQKIGAFFQELDRLITLHQRKPFLMKWRTSDANRNQTNRLVL